MTDARISRAGGERVDELEPLWRALHAHHARLADNLVPARDADESWRLRSDQYRGWLAEERAVLFVADQDERAVGYLMLAAGGAWPTWDLGERVAEVETLVVLPEARGHGIGKALMAQARIAARELGAQSLILGLVDTNSEAERFYEHVGFRRFYVQMLADA